MLPTIRSIRSHISLSTTRRPRLHNPTTVAATSPPLHHRAPLYTHLHATATSPPRLHLQLSTTSAVTHHHCHHHHSRSHRYLHVPHHILVTLTPRTSPSTQPSQGCVWFQATTTGAIGLVINPKRVFVWGSDITQSEMGQFSQETKKRESKFWNNFFDISFKEITML
nr:hypothetical protein [Tanacetum cinerariifolium]